MVPRHVTPRATYRLQFHAGFRFADATALIPYLASIGISHVYASPYLKARAGSTHGYDIVDHSALNPELGTDGDYATFVAELRAHGMGHILDFVPNHMGVGGCDNAWWLDVLTWGENSHYADYFDIDWSPLREQLRGKVLLPFLGSQYGEVLEAGELRWRYEQGVFSLVYFEHCFPLSPPTYALILDHAREESLATFAPLFAALSSIGSHLELRESAAKLQRLVAQTQADAARELAAQLDAGRGTPAGQALIEQVVEAQNWRPTSWKVAAEEINYRRFFDINGLAALRMEHAGTFADAHAFVFALLERGDVDGLRLDHVDGLYDPLGYCDLLRSRGELLGEPFYLVVEKILAAHESLRSRWNVDGTTGYEFMNAVTGIAVDGGAERAFDRLYRNFTGDDAAFADVAYTAKRLVLTTALAAELNVLARRLDRLAQSDPHTRDFTLGAITRALADTIAAFPVYRTYVRGEGVEDEDRGYIDWAIGVARARDVTSDGSIYAFVRRVLLAQTDVPAVRDAYLEFAMRFQQLTSPVAAKGVEDTAFYRSVRLLALNEVGGDPSRFGTSVAEFHEQNALRAAHRPHAMLATATHDAKRGEDVRARLAVLSEIPDDWRRAIGRWTRLNARHAATDADGRAPSSLGEYVFYQTVVSAWPNELLGDALGGDALQAFADRVVATMIKSAREAKLRSSWSKPDEAYEAALERFVRAALAPHTGRRFIESVRDFVRTITPAAIANGLAQTVLRVTAPGVPDTYQGTEFWDLTMVDPDNRRSVDFGARDAAMRAFADALAGGTTREAMAAELLAGWPDGRIKLYVLSTLLRRAAERPSPADAYRPLAAEGARADHVVAYALGGDVIVVPRLPYALAGSALPLDGIWNSTQLRLPDTTASAYRDVLTGRIVATDSSGGRSSLALRDVFAVLPVAVLEPA